MACRLPWGHLESPEALVDSFHTGLQRDTPSSHIPTWGTSLRGGQCCYWPEEQPLVREAWELVDMPQLGGGGGQRRWGVGNADAQSTPSCSQRD